MEKPKEKDRTKEMEAIKAKLCQQYFGPAKPSFEAEDLMDDYASLRIVIEDTKKEKIAKGQKPGSQFTAKVNAAHRTLRDLKKLAGWE